MKSILWLVAAPMGLALARAYLGAALRRRQRGNDLDERGDLDDA